MENNENSPGKNSNSSIVKPSILKIIKFFTKVGATAFGGGVPVHLCDNFLRNKWLNEQECLEALNLCQTLPGATSVNLATFIGWRFQGLIGALVSPFVLLLPGAIIILIVSNILAVLPQQTIIEGALSATAAASIGMWLGTAIRFALSLKQKQFSLIITLITFVFVGIYRLPVPLIILSTGLIVFIWNKLQKVEVNERTN